MERCFEDGVMVRQTADTIALRCQHHCKEEVDIIVDTLAKNLRLIE